MRKLSRKELAKQRRKRCPQCISIKPFKKFYLYSNGIYSNLCKSCEIQRVAAFNRSVRGQRLHRIANSQSMVRTKYGLEPAQSAELKAAGCNVCLRTEDELPGGSTLGHDHDHETGEFRGILCTVDNFLVGWIENGRQFKPTMRSHKAQEYLWNHRN